MGWRQVESKVIGHSKLVQYVQHEVWTPDKPNQIEKDYNQKLHCKLPKDKGEIMWSPSSLEAFKNSKTHHEMKEMMVQMWNTANNSLCRWTRIYTR